MIINDDDYIEHFGVKGMKWGVRNERVRSAKSEYKSARKAYKKSFNKAYIHANTHPISQFVSKKSKARSEALWTQVDSDVKRLNSAKSAYKSAKRKRKAAIDNTAEQIFANSSASDILVYGTTYQKRAAKYVVDNNMSVDEAIKKSKNKTSRDAVAFLAALGLASAFALNR